MARFMKYLAIILYVLLAAWAASGLVNLFRFRHEIVLIEAAPFIILGALVALSSILVVYFLIRDHWAAIPLGVGISVMIASFGLWNFMDFRAREGAGSALAFTFNVLIPLLPAVPLLLLRHFRKTQALPSVSR
jgi:hypothetical protein